MKNIVENDWFDLLLTLALIWAIGGWIWRFFGRHAGIVRHFDINEGNQNELIQQLTVSQPNFANIQNTYSWEDYATNENRITQYAELLFDNLTKEFQGKEHSHKFWRSLTRGQKIFWSYLAFEGEVDNGGLFQFLHNYPEHLFSIRQVMEQLKQAKILADYDSFLTEVSQKKWILKWNIWQSNNPFSTQHEQIQAFSNGYKILESSKIIEIYFYDDDFKMEWHKAMSDYIEKNIEQFAVISANVV